MTIERRKNDHIDICLKENIRTSYDHWDDVCIVHQAIPACNLDDIDLTVDLLGKKLSAPLVISAMTGGSNKAEEYNRNLARVAEEFRIGFGIGSQRAGLEKEEHQSSYSFVKESNIPLVMANLGAPQFAVRSNGKGPEYGVEEVKNAMEMVNADAICIHLNYLQEVVQPEGDTNVKGLLENIMDITKQFKVIGKETGAGISREAALSLKESGVSAIDIGGASGTSFSAVESYRSDASGRSKRIGGTYWDWGIPSPVSLRVASVGLPLIATGGLRNGLDIVRSLALGATSGGMAWPLLQPASKGYDELKREIEHIIEEIRVGIFLSGAVSAVDMSSVKAIITGTSRELLDGMFN